MYYIIIEGADGPPQNLETEMSADTLIISHSAYQSGFGTSFLKEVHGLSREEKSSILSGEVVAYNSGRLSGGNHGTTWRIAIKGRSGRFYPRVPTDEQLQAIEAIGN